MFASQTDRGGSNDSRLRRFQLLPGNLERQDFLVCGNVSKWQFRLGRSMPSMASAIQTGVGNTKSSSLSGVTMGAAGEES